jgi:hypothetical protein
MSISTTLKSSNSDQLNKFRDLARQLECDDEESAFDERLRRIAKVPKRESSKDCQEPKT